MNGSPRTNLTPGPGINGHCSPISMTDVWLTPLWLIEEIGPFDLDPCAAPSPRPWPTAREHREKAGLAGPWFGRVWLNPPYSQVGDWLRLLVRHGRGTALTFARTETRWFHDLIWHRADAVFFFKGRLRFHRPDGRAGKSTGGGPSVLIAYGEEDVQRLHAAKLRGHFLDLRETRP